MSSQRSLTQRLLLWSLGALVLVWACFVTLAYRTGLHEADELTDGQLATASALLLELNAAAAPTPSANPWPLPKNHDYQQSLSVVQWNQHGQLLWHLGSAPVPEFNAEVGYANLQLGPQQQPWRSFSRWDAAQAHKIMVLLRVQERDRLAHDIAGQMVEPGLWLLPVVALALGLAIGRGLRPLHQLSQDVAQLDVQGAQRLASQHNWQEFDAVVDSINTLLARQQEALRRERELANEVAHELRTPLAAIVLQAQALAGGLPAAAQSQALDLIRQDALRAGHVLQQLLALARTSRGQWHGQASPVDIAALARHLAADYVASAWQRQDTLSVQAPEALLLPGHAVLLEMALRNLIENALRHTPPGTQIELQCGPGTPEHGAWLQVCDDGARPLAQAQAKTPPPSDSLHLGQEIIARVAAVHGARFGTATAPAPFTTCYRIDFAPTPTPQGP
ncbi:MAG: histidine kinase dimerization/phospho-acceptor domain-containing protein [Giesbergeria sp.]|uniref:histidine kinase dimerization/phospho-acceptor domain-containing protein n=1 Tax=Giesbergeria sp. TaxID=2818473 RepID=UPI0026225388|nr:histidine kinase dimerization/phospho-acceptor domain-containing protein [Giesbergeria sp.]MDD2608908.1 histidine kinase dimerization/phospho-acceptor domain-containing protein [Giesbergeria sp.]